MDSVVSPNIERINENIPEMDRINEMIWISWYFGGAHAVRESTNLQSEQRSMVLPMERDRMK